METSRIVNGVEYKVRNLDEEPLTPQEAALAKHFDFVEETLDNRLEELSVAPFYGSTGLAVITKYYNETKGITNAEKDIVRGALKALVRTTRAQRYLRDTTDL